MSKLGLFDVDIEKADDFGVGQQNHSSFISFKDGILPSF